MLDAMDSDNSFFDEPANEDYEDEDKPLKAKDVDPKLKAKYAFLFKSREDLKPEERKWNWIKKEFYPEELTELIERLKKKPTKKDRE